MTVAADPAPARRGRPGHSLDTLLDAAVALFNERGYEATSMDELAARLGVTKSAIYHHVPSKVELLRLALDRALDALFALTEETGATTGPAIDRLEYVVRGSVRVLAAELPFVTLLLRLRGQLRDRADGAAPAPRVRPRRHRRWCGPPSTRATCGPTSIPPSSAGCCSAP